MYQRIAALLPKKLVQKIGGELGYLGIDVEEKKFVGFIFFYALGLSFGIALNLYIIFKVPLLESFAAMFIFSVCGVYLWLSIAAESKGKFVEGVLPDALQLIASNIKAGMTTERALFISARPEFGPLETELKAASRKILAGMRVEKAMGEISKNIKSTVLDRTIWLISKGISSGGQIADLLMQLSNDLREQKEVQEETAANVSMYVMLIFFSAAIGAPLLFGVSTFIVQILGKQVALIPTIDAGSLGAAAGQQKIGILTTVMGAKAQMVSLDFVILFVVLCIVASAIFASLTMGIINTGKEKNGFKYLPFMLIVSFGVFFAVRIVLAATFGGMMK